MVKLVSISQALLVAEHLSFSRAAQVLGIRQSAVTGASPPPMRRGVEPSNLRVIRTARVGPWIMPALMPCIRTGTRLMHIGGSS